MNKNRQNNTKDIFSKFQYFQVQFFKENSDIFFNEMQPILFAMSG